MRSFVLCLAVAIALTLVLPHCNAILCSKATAAASAVTQAASETVVQSGGCGCGCGAGNVLSCKKRAKKGLVSAAVGTATGIVGSATSMVGTATNMAGRAISSVPGACGLLSETQIRQKYAQQKGEPLDSWFKRIVSRSYEWTATPQAYIQTLSLVWKDFNTLPLWYDRKYFSLINDFYSSFFARQDNEPEDAYYSRLVTRQPWETDECFARRISVMRDCFPKLDLWTSPKWFNKYTKNLYTLEFQRFAQESELDYIKRIFERDEIIDRTDDAWANRLFLIQEATISKCPLWYNNQYLPYFKKFYSVWYKKKDTETPDAWLTRALALLPGESPENAIKRISIIKEVTSDYGFWSPDFFKKVQVSKCYDSDWLNLVQKSFFPGGCGGTIVEQSSSKVAAAASASASVSSESLKVVSA